MIRLPAAFAVLLAAGCPSADAPPAPEAETADAAPRPFREVLAEKLGTDAAPPEDAVALFDGETFFGWRIDEAPDGVWSVEDHAIVGRGEAADILFTAMPWIDGQLTLEVKLSPGGNSGVFVRSALDPKDLKADTFELNLASTHPEGYTTGSVVGRKKVRDPWPAVDDGRWHELVVTLTEDAVAWSLGGGEEVRMDLTPEDRRFGYIGLQHRAGDVAFRRVLFRPDLPRTLTGGFEGWRVVNQKMKDGTLAEVSFEPSGDGFRATGGPGFLESEATYADFVFRGVFTTGAPDTNSGLFYRTVKGTPEAPSNGYEVQVHNGFEGPERKPTNAGTGAVFRRQDARIVAAEDGSPAALTVNAYGDRVMTWVNGYPVVDWTDGREPDDNPRRGKRLEAGHLSFQAHDPGTDVSVRAVGVTAFPAGDE